MTTQNATTSSVPAGARIDVPPGVGQSAGRSVRRWALQALVVAILAVVAIWGHTSDWTLPTFLASDGSAESASNAWCAEHSVPESQCIECQKGLVPAVRDYGWCKEHGVSNCTLHHPELVQLKSPPSTSPEQLERAAAALALRPRSENNSRCQLHKSRIQFASVEAVEKAGVDIAVAIQRPIVEAIEANGEVVYDQTRRAHLASRVAGTVWRVERQVGDRVRKDDLLALVDSAEVGRAKSELLQAVSQLRLKGTNLERLKPLAETNSIPARQIREAEAAVEEAKIHILTAQQTLVNLGLPVKADDLVNLEPTEMTRAVQFLGLPATLVAELETDSASSNLLPIRSPLDGVIIERSVVAGEAVDAAAPLFDVADVSRMWLMLDVRQEDAKLVELGQNVLFKASETAGESPVEGTVSWISTAADHRTRSVKVRVDLANEDGRLRANTFGAGRVVLRKEPTAIVVPSEAVHWDGCCHVVFVRDKNYLSEGAPKFFHVRKVRPGVTEGNLTEIIVGLAPGEVLASKNSVLLEAQLLKSHLGLGEGCGCTH
jgi:cobalt-zinc-cadmium efflux system membrane fusion protein